VKGARAQDITPVGIQMSRDGKRAFVALGRANHVAFVDVAARKVTDLVLVGKRAWNVALDKAEERLFVVNGLSDDLTVVDVAGRQADQDRAGRPRAVRRGDRRMRWTRCSPSRCALTLCSDAAGTSTVAAATLKATLISAGRRPAPGAHAARARLPRPHRRPGHRWRAGGARRRRFELEAAGAAVALSVVTAATPESARAAAQAAEKAGAALMLTDLPADWTLAVADAVKLPVLNLGDSADDACASRTAGRACST
jgi:hypothetical protein